MTADTLKNDLGLIGEEVLRAAKENFTGKLNMTLHMKNGGIGQITILLQKNLKKKGSNFNKNKE